MKNFRLLSIFFPLILVSCMGPKIDNIVRDESFTARAIETGTFWVGGITTLPTGEDLLDELEYELTSQAGVLDSILLYRLIERFPVIDIRPTAELRVLLGDENYRQITTIYRGGAAFSGDAKILVSAIHPDSNKFLLFVRFERDRLSHREISIDSGKTTTYFTFRETAAAIQIYRTSDFHLVWNGNVQVKVKTTNEYKEPNEGFLEGLAKDIILGESEAEPGYPEPASLSVICNRIFSKFAENLAIRK